jgi:DNA-binding XRE family transcriptional regulator
VIFLRKLRNERGWSKYRAAKELNMLPQSYYHIEDKGQTMKFTDLLKVQRVYRLTDTELMEIIRDEYGQNGG